MKKLSILLHLVIIALCLSGCAFHTGGNYCDYIKGNIYCYGHRGILGWGKLRYDIIIIGDGITPFYKENVNFSIKMPSGKIIKISSKNLSEETIRQVFAMKGNKKNFTMRCCSYAVKPDGEIYRYYKTDLKGNVIEQIYNDARIYYIADFFSVVFSTQGIPIYFDAGGADIYMKKQENKFELGDYAGRKFFKFPLSQEQLEYIFGKPDGYRKYWY